jgi:hypothetical protein
LAFDGAPEVRDFVLEDWRFVPDIVPRDIDASDQPFSASSQPIERESPQ